MSGRRVRVDVSADTVKDLKDYNTENCKKTVMMNIRMQPLLTNLLYSNV